MAKSSIGNMFWATALFWARFGINAGVFLVIANWIPMAEVGAYGAAFALIQILQAIQSSGLPEAVINGTEEETQTAFWLSVAFGILAGCGMYFGSQFCQPLVGDLGVKYLQMLACVPVLMGFGAVSEAVLRRNLQLKRLTTRTTISLTASGLVAIFLAWRGHGGWALIVLTIVNNGFASLMNLFMAPWRPRMEFHSGLVMDLLRRALSISGRNVVKSGINPCVQFVITGYLGVVAGGAFLIAVRLATIISSLTLMPAQYLALPLFSKLKDNPNRRQGAFLDAISVMSVVASPLYVGIAILAPLMLPFVLTTTAQLVTPLVQGLLFHSPILIILNLAVPAFVAAGGYGVSLRLTIAQLIVMVGMATLAAQWSVIAVAWSYPAAYLVVLPLFLRQLRLLLGIGSLSLLRSAFMPWFAAVLAGLLSALVWHYCLHWPFSIRLAAAAGVGVLAYGVLVWLVARSSLRVTRDRLLIPIRQKLQRRRTLP